MAAGEFLQAGNGMLGVEVSFAKIPAHHQGTAASLKFKSCGLEKLISFNRKKAFGLRLNSSSGTKTLPLPMLLESH
ncbi:hypothetical protein DSO57_1000438 [Entomophthora muscae]|uniref:Uncharacterized protein n=1 Tax=Entomophthora muscae TaxID=34485 RepID=A0ACC2UJZ9_9FUNG|nr:hypothetical protein DSO57_1000438 [Entomophthora muscae]